MKISNAVYASTITRIKYSLISVGLRFMQSLLSQSVSGKNKYKNNKRLNSLSFELYTRQTPTFLLQQSRSKVDIKYARVLSCKFALSVFIMYHIFSRYPRAPTCCKNIRVNLSIQVGKLTIIWYVFTKKEHWSMIFIETNL